MPRYFAYGSNMNSERMAGRDLQVVSSVAGYIDGFQLCFNKRSRHHPKEARANIGYARNGRVEGVLYELASMEEITKLDPHEGTPRYYSRERFTVITQTGPLAAWVYVANPTAVAEDVLPPRWYVEHLLAGEEFLSAEYLAAIANTPCLEKAETIDIG